MIIFFLALQFLQCVLRDKIGFIGEVNFYMNSKINRGTSFNNTEMGFLDIKEHAH